MGFLDQFFKSKNSGQVDVISGGKQKQDGSHDHRTNVGGDRTPAQKEADKKRQKERSSSLSSDD